MFRNLYNWTLRWAGSRHAPKALGAISFTESSFFPIPADVLFIPMCLSRPDRVWRYALIASVMSVLGGIGGWMIGHFAFETIARPLLEAMGKIDSFNKLKGTTGQGAILLMLVTSGFSHIPPMKVVTILSGLVSFDLKWFILSAIVARAGRFYLLAWALRRYGAAVVEFIERRFAAVALATAIAAAVLWAAVHAF
jgi:membrane protein YqaA with SNARE-associated domain